MALNKLSDLNNHLFAEMERLGDEELEGEKLKEEIERAKSITLVSKQIVSNARLTFDALKYENEKMPGGKELPEQLRLKK